MFVHEEVWDAFRERFVEGARNLKVGDPLDASTDVGPMVDANAASRIQKWVDEAIALGGRVLLGGKSDGTFFPPTVLTDVPATAQVCSNEAFAPLVVAFRYRDFDDAIAPGQRQRSSGSRPACSRTTCSARGRHSRSSRSAA